MSTGDAAQQHSVQLTVPGAQMVVGEQGSGQPSSNGGSAAPHVAGKQRGAAMETQNAGIVHATASASELIPSADFNRRLEAFLQPVVADVLRRKCDSFQAFGVRSMSCRVSDGKLVQIFFVPWL